MIELIESGSKPPKVEFEGTLLLDEIPGSNEIFMDEEPNKDQKIECVNPSCKSPVGIN